MNNKLLELIDPKTPKDPWHKALETQAKNITLSGGVVLGVVGSKKEQPMTYQGYKQALFNSRTESCEKWPHETAPTCNWVLDELLYKIKTNRRLPYLTQLNC